SDLTFQMERFYSWGYVHTGFYDSLRPLAVYLASALDMVLYGDTLKCPRHMGVGEVPTLQHPPSHDRPEKLKALFITGHSLGAAIALLATALLYVHPDCKKLRSKLRGVYTFGTPKVGDLQFARKCQAEFGPLVFRHIYQNDVVTAMPPK